ncbi:D-Ala-D-Ala carboxypeptidase family metallohydrolase [Marinobacter confluentis]|uniref:D-Ala-D-Ala carboxypeptidase family metallohydrolase n=1 Tax=Marinobacter confluentis TaxID=1697557 RepID=UPI0017853CC6|nr:D-Ala-D-Ala carboxypeptidase family metallohydrolase [Marinobacter confluentis]
MLSLTLVWVLILVGLGTPPAAWADSVFDPGRLSFSVTVNDRLTPYHTMLASVMPGKTLDIQLTGTHLREAFSVSAPGGQFSEKGRGGWRWHAPDNPGYYPLQITRRESNETLSLRVFVLVPATQVRDGRLNGYRIGHYPEKPFRGLAAYAAPTGFIEVTEENVRTQVSPHFRLGQFLSKQQSGYPKYLLLSPRLLTKLELLLEDVNAAGIRTNGFVIMSGFRTPFYNRLIGSSTNSRHMFGGAADIYIDDGQPRGMMDDLNNDGASDRKDAAILYDLAEDLPLRHGLPELIGGLGEYDARLPVRGPFIHVDVRRLRARWGRSPD